MQRNKLIKEVNDLYNEKPMKEIEGTKWGKCLTHGLERVILLRCLYYPK
jgi:hypothetical protein